MDTGEQVIEFRATVKDGVIEIPNEYLGKIKGRVRVILVPEAKISSQRNLIDQLLESPVPIRDFQPIKRAALYEHGIIARSA
jgi:hypothetical protein